MDQEQYIKKCISGLKIFDTFTEYYFYLRECIDNRPDGTCPIQIKGSINKQNLTNRIEAGL